MICSAEIAMPISARHAESVRHAIASLSISTPSQSKMMSSGDTVSDIPIVAALRL